MKRIGKLHAVGQNPKSQSEEVPRIRRIHGQSADFSVRDNSPHDCLVPKGRLKSSFGPPLWILGFGVFLGFGISDLGFSSSAVAAAATETTSSTGLANDTLAATNRVDAIEQRRGRFGGPERGVYKAQIAARWFQN